MALYEDRHLLHSIKEAEVGDHPILRDQRIMVLRTFALNTRFVDAKDHGPLPIYCNCQRL